MLALCEAVRETGISVNGPPEYLLVNFLAARSGIRDHHRGSLS